MTLTGNTDGNAKTCQVTTRSRVPEAVEGSTATFHTTTGVNAGTELITTDAAHGFSAGDVVIYSKEGGSAATGPTDLDKMFAAPQVAADEVKFYSTLADAITDDGATNIIDWTAVGTETHKFVSGAFEALSGETVSFISGAGYVATFDILLPDNDSDLNNYFEIYADTPGAVSGDDPVLGTIDAVLVNIEGSGAGGTGNYLVNASSDFVFHTDMSEWIYTQGSANSENWVSALNSGLTTPDSGGVGVPTTIRHGDSSTTIDSLVNDTAWFSKAALCAIPFEVQTAGDHYIYIRGYHSGSLQRSIHACIDTSTSGSHKAVFDQAQNTWDWRPIGTAGVIAFNLSVGIHTLYVATREVTTELYFNKVLINRDAVAPTDNSDVFSTAGSVVVTDNPLNPSTPIGPTSGAVVTPSVVPANGSTDVPKGTNITLTFTGTGMAIDFNLISVLSGASPVTGTWTSDGVNTATFVPDNLFSDAAVITLDPFSTDVGSIVNSDLTSSPIQLGAAWSVTIIDGGSLPAGVTFSQDFSTVTGVPRLLIPSQDLPELFDSNVWVGPDGSNVTSFVTDPTSSGRGTVLQHEWPQGACCSAMHSRDWPTPGSPRTLYYAEDVRVQPGYLAPASVHFGGMFSAPDNVGHSGPITSEINPQKCRTGLNFYGPQNYTRGNNCLACYVYRGRIGQNIWFGPYFWNTVDPTRWQATSSTVGQARIPVGRWFTYQCQMTLNTFTGSTANSDGILRAWIIDSQLNGGAPLLVLNVTNVRLIEEDHALGINLTSHSITYAGGGAVAAQDDTIQRDNLIISTDPIIT